MESPAGFSGVFGGSSIARKVFTRPRAQADGAVVAGFEREAVLVFAKTRRSAQDIGQFKRKSPAGNTQADRQFDAEPAADSGVGAERVFQMFERDFVLAETPMGVAHARGYPGAQ